jgi:molybdopterin/thiamine biosynthesis adenylyltransferase
MLFGLPQKGRMVLSAFFTNRPELREKFFSGQAVQPSDRRTFMLSGKDRRRTIRIKRSSLLECKLGDLDRPAIKIAETLEEYTGAFSLVHDEYVRSGYTSPHPSRLLFNAWSMLPQTAVFVFKSFHEVLSSVTYIPDTADFGLPIDAVFKDKIDELRKSGPVVEVGALVTQRRRRWSNMMVFLAKALLKYAQVTGAANLVVMVNPKHVRFYTSLFMFKPFAEERFYEKVGAPAVALRICMKDIESELKAAYAEEAFETDLHHFFLKAAGTLPENIPSQASPDDLKKKRPIDPYSAYYLLRRRPDVLDSLTEKQRAVFENYYHQALFSLPGGVGAFDPERTTGNILEKLKLDRFDAYTDTAFCRNLGLLTYDEQRKLLDSRVAVAGLGGVGGEHLVTLARTGFGKFTIAEFDEFSPVNVNRQYGATVSAFGRAKLDVMLEYAMGVNPFLDIRKFPSGISEENLDDFLDGVDVVVDGIDFFAFDIRCALFMRAYEKGIPVITAGPMGYSCALLVFMPGGMDFIKYFDIRDDMDMQEKLLRFALGLAPRALHVRYLDRRFVDMRERRGPSLDIACRVCAGMATTEAVRLVLGKKGVRAVPEYTQFDPFTGKYHRGKLKKGLASFPQKLKLRLARAVFTPPPPEGAAVPATPAVCKPLQPVPRSVMEYIVRAGVQAPSGDNSQPWRFRIGDRRIELFADRERDTSFFNVAQAATLISCGAVLENMRYAAGAAGLETELTLLPDGEGADRVGVAEFEPVGMPLYELAESSMWRRCTTRLMFKKKPVPQAVWQRLDRMVAGEAMLSWVTDRGLMKGLAAAVYKADRARVERRDLHEYLMEHIRFGPHEGPHGDGLPLKNLQAGVAGELFMKFTQPWRVMRLLNILGAGRMVPLHGRQSVIASGGLGMISIAAATEEQYLRAGAVFNRLWCALEYMGYGLQPLAALPLLNLRLRLEGESRFDPQHVVLLREADRTARAAFGIPEGALPLMMFRTGESRRVRYRTFRRDVASMLV